MVWFFQLMTRSRSGGVLLKLLFVFLFVFEQSKIQTKYYTTRPQEVSCPLYTDVSRDAARHSMTRLFSIYMLVVQESFNETLFIATKHAVVSRTYSQTWHCAGFILVCSTNKTFSETPPDRDGNLSHQVNSKVGGGFWSKQQTIPKEPVNESNLKWFSSVFWFKINLFDRPVLNLSFK